MANQPGKAAGFSLPCRYRKIITFMRYLKRPFRSIEGSPIPYRLIIRDLRTNQGKCPDKKVYWEIATLQDVSSSFNVRRYAAVFFASFF